MQDAGGLAAAARTVDGSGVDRIGQQSNRISAKLLLNVRRRLQLREARELDVSTDGVRTDRDSANRIGQAARVISAEPTRSRRTCSLYLETISDPKSRLDEVVIPKIAIPRRITSFRMNRGDCEQKDSGN